MHELSLAHSMLRIVEEQFGGKPRLLAATVTVGLFSGVEVESLRFAFEELARAEGFGEPSLVVRKVFPRARCQGCEAEYDLTDVLMPCPKCGSVDRHIEGGFDFSLDSVEIVEEEDDATEAEEG